MSLLPERVQQEVKAQFDKLNNDVDVVFFTQELECQYCRETHQLLEELAKLSERIKLSIRNFQIDTDEVEAYRIDKIPAIVVKGEEDYGIRLYGIPSGYEFTSLVQVIMDVGARKSGLSDQTIARVREIESPVHLQVMVTPTCPYCPRAVIIANKFAMENPHIRADMVEVSEFPFLAHKYEIQGVPVTIINETGRAMGAVPESQLLSAIDDALSNDSVS